MNCPIDNTPLQMTERQGIELDYCSQCRGVWLDRGELDKIIERSSQETSQYPPTSQNQPHRQQDHGGYKKRKSFLSEIFD